MKYIPTTLVMLILVALMTPVFTEAKTVMWNQHFPQSLYYYWIDDGVYNNKDLTPVSGVANGAYIKGLSNYNVQVQYHADVINCDTGSNLADGATVPVGTRLKFLPRPHVDTDIYWFGTGYSIDTPYGNWIEDAGVPDQFCTADDYVETVQTDGSFTDIYIPLNIDAPNDVSVTQKGTALLGTSDAQGCQLVTSAGSIVPEFSYGDTYGKFYYRYTKEAKGKSCVGNSLPMVTSSSGRYEPPDKPAYILNVPRQTITFNLQAVGGKQPPNPPVISGNQSLAVGQVEPYSFVATDPDNDTIAYDIDWDNNGTVDQRLPAIDFIPSGTSQSQAKSWVTTGTKTFQARTRDADGLLSGWTTYTVTVGNGVTVASCSANPGSINSGQSATWSATITGGTSPYTYAWTGTDGATGSGPTLTKTYLTAGTKATTVTVTDANGASDTRTCNVLVVNDIPVPPPTPPTPPTSTSPVTLEVDRPLVRIDERITLTWDTGSNDPAACTLEPGLTVFLSSSTGSTQVTMIGSTTFRLTCPGGTDTVEVRMLATPQET